MIPLFIFDLDGTIADAGHRSHYLYRKGDPARWRLFYAACDKDKPVLPVIRTMEALRRGCSDVWVWTGRSSEVRETTVAWIATHTSFLSTDLVDPVLRMRDDGDHRPDYEVKKEWLEGLSGHDRQRLVAVYEDRNRVVEMWRSNGVAAFQVAWGDF